MKTCITIILGAACVSWLACASSAAVILPAIGPDPSGWQTPSAGGQLEVFSKLQGHSEGNNPPWYQHADYYVCDQRGHELQQVHNTVGHYASAPRLVTLPVGKYLVKAPAKNAFWLDVPVVIESGRVTKVHLDGDWKPPTNTPDAKFVTAPAGYPVGWRSDSAQ